jgi:hypothetical protein
MFLDGHPLALAGVDGVLSAPDDNTEDARFGIRYDGNYPLKGALDDVRVYNRALTDAEVIALLLPFRLAPQRGALFPDPLCFYVQPLTIRARAIRYIPKRFGARFLHDPLECSSSRWG